MAFINEQVKLGNYIETQLAHMKTSELIARANNASPHTFANSSQRYWKLDWCTPVKPKPTQNSGKGNGENVEGEKYNFMYKAWMPSEVPAWKQLEVDENEILDLSMYDRTKKVVAPQVGSAPTSSGQNAGNGLTADDIRGAVGGQESIPSFSGSDAIAKKEKEALGAAGAVETTAVEATEVKGHIQPEFEATVAADEALKAKTQDDKMESQAGSIDAPAVSPVTPAANYSHESQVTENEGHKEKGGDKPAEANIPGVNDAESHKPEDASPSVIVPDADGDIPLE